MTQNKSYTTLADFVKELPGEDLRRWNLNIFKKYPEKEKELISHLRQLKLREERLTKIFNRALKLLENIKENSPNPPHIVIHRFLYNEIDDFRLRRSLKYLKYAETKTEIRAIIKHLIDNAHKSFMQSRLKAIRKVLNEITDLEFKEWLKNNNKEPKFLDISRIDRIIIEVFDTENIVLNEISEHTNLHKLKYSKEIIAEEIIEKLSEEEEENIDEVIQKWKKLKKLKEESGRDLGGIKIREFEIDHIKIKTMFYYNTLGSPIRLRVITNIQEAVKRELWKDEEIRKMYQLATWKKDSETNFILPEHIEIYRRKEKEICQKVKEFAIKQFKKECEEIKLKHWTINLYVSIVEICYELPGTTYQNKLEDAFIERYKKFKKYAGTFIKLKYDMKTNRPHLFLDLLYMNPEEPTLTFKIYPKFIHNGKAYIRREIVGRKIMKYLYSRKSDKEVVPKGIAFYLLDEPETARYMLLKFLEFQMGDVDKFIGIYESNREFTKKAKLLGINERILAHLILYGKIPPHTHSFHKRRLLERGIVEKKKHGEYVLTPEGRTLIMSVFRE